MSLIFYFFSMQQWTPVIKKINVLLISEIIIWNILQSFLCIKMHKNVTSFNTQYKEAPLGILWKIIIKKNNMDIFEVYM